MPAMYIMVFSSARQSILLRPLKAPLTRLYGYDHAVPNATIRNAKQRQSKSSVPKAYQQNQNAPPTPPIARFMQINTYRVAHEMRVQPIQILLTQAG